MSTRQKCVIRGMGQQSSPQHSTANGKFLIDFANDNLVISNDSNQKILTLGKQPNGLFSLLFNNGSDNVLLVGQDSTGAYVVKIAEAGYDPVTASNANLVFNSNQKTFQIVDQGSVPFSVTSTSGAVGYSTASITHDLGYVPLSFSMVSIDQDWNGQAGLFPVPYIFPNAVAGVDGGATFMIVSFVRVLNVTNTEIEFAIGEIAGGSTISGTIYTYFLQENAT